MKPFIPYVIAIAAVVAVIRHAEAECFALPREVWHEHPKSHATWRLINGEMCWHAGFPLTHARRGRRSFDHDGMAAPVPPLPRSRPELEVLHPEIYPRLLPAYGRALSRELLGESAR